MMILITLGLTSLPDYWIFISPAASGISCPRTPCAPRWQRHREPGAGGYRGLVTLGYGSCRKWSRVVRNTPAAVRACMQPGCPTAVQNSLGGSRIRLVAVAEHYEVLTNSQPDGVGDRTTATSTTARCSMTTDSISNGKGVSRRP